MVRQTKTIKETVKEAQDFLKKLNPKKVSCSIRDTIKEAAAFLQRDGPLEKRNRTVAPERVAQPIKKKITKHKAPAQRAKNQPVQKKIAATKKAQKPSKVKKVAPKNTKKPVIKAKAPQRRAPIARPQIVRPQNTVVIPAKQSQLNESPLRKPTRETAIPKVPPQKTQAPKAVAKEKPVAQKKQDKAEKKQAPKPAKDTKINKKRKPSPSTENDEDDHSSFKQRESSAEKPKQVKKIQKEPKQTAKIEPNNKHEPQQKKQIKKSKPVQEENHLKEEIQRELKQEVPNLPRRTQTDRTDPSKPKAGMVDVVFVLDTTGSMGEYLEKIQSTVNTLVQNIRARTNESDVSVRFGFVAYRDHPPQETTYLTRVKDLCTSAEILEFVSELDCQGGGDGAEAVYDGLNDAAQNISWRYERNVPTLRYVFHIADQPPHGKDYKGYSELWDETGCPCGITLDQLSHRINVNDIHYRLIRAANAILEPMAKIFKEKFLNFDECNLEGEAEKMNIRISDMVIRELCPDIDYDG